MNTRLPSALLVLALALSATLATAQVPRRARPGAQPSPNPAANPPSAAGQPLPPGRPEDNARLEGAWLGVVHRYPTLIYAELTLTSGPGGLEGTLKFQPMAEHWAKTSIDTSLQAGSATMAVVFNGTTDTFRFAVQRRGTGGRIDAAGALANVTGALDQKNGVLAGRDASRQDFFVFARPDKFTAIDKSFRTFRDESPGAAGRGFNLGGGGPAKAEMIRWMEPFFREFPETDPYRTAHGPLEMKAINLFEDAHFSAFFGKRFDTMSGSELSGIWWGNVRGGTDKPGQALAAIAGMFQTVIGTHNAKQTTLWVIAHRALRSWRQACLDQLARLEPGDTAFATIQGVSDQLTALTKDLFWPSEEKQGAEAVAAARRRLALPILEQKMRALETAALDNTAYLALTHWDRNESVLLGHIDAEARAGFQRRAAAQLARSVDALMPAERAKVAALGAGLPAVVAGTAWHAAFAREYQSALNTPAAQGVVAAFRERRARDLAAAAGDMEADIRRAHAKIPPGISAAGDQARLAFANDVRQRLGSWFGTPGDANTDTARRINALAAELNGEARSLLPPSKRGQVANSNATRPATGTPRERATVGWETVARAIASTDSAEDALRLPAPMADAGFEFATDICWSIFHGRFDQIRAGAAQAAGLGTRMTAALRDTNPHFHYAFVTYVGLTSAKYGARQFGPSTELGWQTYSVNRNTGERTPVGSGNKNSVHIALHLKEHYEESYKIAEGAANADGTFGGDVLGFFKTYENLVKNGLLSQAGKRADGSVAFMKAGWEGPIMSDLATLLEKWPDRAQAVWQFHENIRRYLGKRASLQEVFDSAVRAKGWSDLHLAAHRDHADAIAAMKPAPGAADPRDQEGNTPLHLAALAGNQAAMSALVRAGADAKARNAHRKTPLHLAALTDDASGAPAAVHLLLAAGAEVDARDTLGRTPLHHAATLGLVPIVQALLKGGAKPGLADNSGVTPLQAAMKHDRADVLRPLLQGGGADLRAKATDGNTVLHNAAASNAKELIGELVAKGADVNATNDKGQTPLHVAAMNGAAAAIDALIIRGANPQAKDAAGRTPLDQAIASNKEAAILAIRKHTVPRP